MTAALPTAESRCTSQAAPWPGIPATMRNGNTPRAGATKERARYVRRRRESRVTLPCLAMAMLTAPSAVVAAK